MKYFQYKIFYRYDRVFLPYPVKGNNITFDEYNKQCQKVRCARIHLKYLCDKTLQKEHGTNLDVAEEQTALDNLLLDIQTRQHPALGNFLFAFIYRTEDPSVTQCMAKLLSLLIGDAAISSVVPFRYHQHLLQTCFKVRNHQDFRDHLNEMKEYGVELSDLLRTSNFHGFSTKCVEFLEYLIDQTVLVHSHDQILQQAQPINNSYNPETGMAYYFTSHGCQVRKQPVYTINQKSKNYDDVPIVDNLCKKKFPEVSYGGYGYMFLWFCPIHGHCYGFHLISGGEGRKDPFSSLFKYLPEPPTDIFYDFACQYSEYCLNREPQYFLKTRFWHDIFHSITHKCGKCFKSSRICGMVGINSEICEQFNSYMQCVKYTASHLSQSHFMFFVQFFIYLWNVDKTNKFQSIIDIAISGTL